MASCEQALALAARGFFIFPCGRESKLPAIKEWQHKATRDEDQIRKWWLDPMLETDKDYNIGIFTGRFGENEALLVVDIDCKGNKNGYDTIFELELAGHEFPPTYSVVTASGGKHLYYRIATPIRQGANTLGIGIDTRSHGGFVVGPGSGIGAGYYVPTEDDINPSPEWIIRRCGAAATDERQGRLASVDLGSIDADRAEKRGREYLATAPVAVEGAGGDEATFKVACKLKDLGCDEALAEELMAELWNPQCSPPWSGEELATKVKNAYRYGKQPIGAAAPEAQFSAAVPDEDDEGAHPLDKLNKEYAYIKKGAFVLQETTNELGNFTTNHLGLSEFHNWHANKPFQVGKHTKAISEAWMESPRRREYEGVVFAPQQDRGPRWYNLWKGFSVEKAANSIHVAVDLFKEHLLLNVCHGDAALAHWLTGYFAHMVQRPYEKPLVALVFKGKKGTGKNALVERVGHLLNGHFMVADDDRYLLSNFNSHLESCLFMVLDEAAWAGDKRAEGRLKGLITGAQHNIERKGREPYTVANLTRIAIIGNEEWIVPASADERRFAVFTVGDGRKQDRRFFHDMRVGLEKGGYPHLLKYLLDYDISGVDVNEAPVTKGLLEQKLESLELVHRWWFECLSEGRITGSEFGQSWPDKVGTDRFENALRQFAKGMNVKSRLPDRNTIGKTLKAAAKSVDRKKWHPQGQSTSTWCYALPSLEQARAEWENFIGHTINWGD